MPLGRGVRHPEIMKRTLKAIGLAVATIVVASMLVGMFIGSTDAIMDIASPAIFVLGVLVAVAWYRWDKPSSLGG